jgi:parallel beta-helix repeat protein
MNTSNGWPLNGMVDDLRVYDKEVPLMDLMREVPGLSMGDFSVQEYITSTAEGRVKLELQRLVDTAVARGQKEIKLPEGRFYLEKGLVIAGIDGFSLKGAGKGKTILVRADGVVVSVSESENITFEDFSVDVEPLPFTQGTITSVKKEPSGGHIMDFELHEGYPRLTEEALQQVHGTAWFMDKDTRRLKEGRGWFGPKPGRNVLRVDDSHGQLKLWNAVDIGDYIVLKIHGAVPFVLRDSESVRLEDIEILASSSLGVAARFLTGENYFRYTIKPGPTPPGATQARLVSSNADGIQYFWCPGAVTFEDCDFGYMGDDGVNISIPTALQVVEVQSPTRVLASTRTAEPEMKRMIEMSAPGDIIRLLRYGTFEPLGDLPLQAMSWDGRREGVQWLADEHGTSQGKGEMSFVTVEFQRTPKVPIKVGDRLSPRKFLPKRFAIRNSRFHDTRARGLLIMASNGIIEGNTIEYTYLSGIELCHEIPGFGGLGWVSDVAVRNNTLRDVCIMGGPGFVNWAAIALCNTSISPRKEPPGAYPWAIGHRNVDITGNTIDRCYGAGILVNGLDGGTVASNTIRRSNQREEHSAQKKEGVTAVHPITIMNSKGITISGNKIIEPGAYAHEPYVNDIGMYPPKQ